MKRKVTLGALRTTYTGKIFSIFHRAVTLPDGTKTVYEYCKRPASVSVLAFNEKGELLMIKENRVGYKHDTWFLPGGRMDHRGDTAKKAAIREMREESGYRPKQIRQLFKKSPASTLIWDIYLFVARDLVYDPLPKDPGEITSTHFVPLKDAVEMALDGTIENEFIAYDIIRFSEMLKRGEFKW